VYGCGNYFSLVLYKADVLECLEVENFQVTNVPVVDAKLFDGAAIVQILNP